MEFHAIVLAVHLAPILGYSQWESFEGVIEKAKQAASSIGSDPRYNFLEAPKVVARGRTTGPIGKDYILSRYGCHLIAMHGDPRKMEIAAAQV